MNTEQYLSQLRFLRRQIICKRRDAEMWRAVAENLGGSVDTERVQASGASDKMADAIARAVDCERDVNELTCNMVALQREIMLQIDAVGDPDCSMVLNEYYIHGMSLSQISSEWGRSLRHIKRVKADAIAMFSAKFGEIF